MRKYIYYIVMLFPFLISCSHENEKMIEQALIVQLEKYPESRLQDIYKNFYQDRFGTGHAISDIESVRQYMEYELEHMKYSDFPMVEPLGWEQNFVRVSLSLVKDGKISGEDLLDAFIESAYDLDSVAMDNWSVEWETIIYMIEKNNLPIVDFEKDRDSISNLLLMNPRIPIHHSESFRKHYNPHYRVVKKSIFDRICKDTP